MLPLGVAQPRRSVLNSAICELHLLVTVLFPTGSSSRSATCDALFTGGLLRVSKNTHKSVNVENRPHIDINFFYHKDLGNQFLQ